MVQSGQLYHIDDNDYCCPYSSDHIPPTATILTNQCSIVKQSGGDVIFRIF